MDIKVPDKMEIDISKNKYHKFKSTKLIITIWAIAMISYIVISKQSEFMPIAELLCACPLAYYGTNYLQKKLYKDEKCS